MQEGQSKRIELKEQNPYLAVRMLRHLYGFDYSGRKLSLHDEPETSHVSELCTHAQMYALADEYEIKDLKEEALWKFSQTLDALEGHDDELKTALETVPLIYSTTPDNDRGLRDVIVAYGAKDLEHIKNAPELKSAVTLVPIYMIEVLPKFFTRSKNEHVTECCWHCTGLGKPNRW